MSIWPIFLAYAILIFSAWLFSRWLRTPSAAGRYASLDGMRGYLAFGVFIHHGSVWYLYLHTGKWEAPPSHVYSNIGQASVTLFFMITAFLFWSKLLRGRAEPINSYKLYLSRFLRLVPLYLLVVVLIGLTAAFISHFHLTQSIYALSKEAIKWSSFTLLGAPNINGVEHTDYIVACVTWSLEYEWLFYLTLPLMALVVGAAAPRRFIAASLIAAAFICFRLQRNFQFNLHVVWTFAGGIIAAYLVRSDRFRAFAVTRYASMIVLLALGAAITFFPTAFGIWPLTLLSIAFVIIAAGSTCFGILTWNSSLLVGEATYSVYLIHGIVLFWLFRFLIGFSDGASYTVNRHWFAVCCCIPLLLGVSCATYRYVEAPAMQSAPKVASWIRERIHRRPG